MICVYNVDDLRTYFILDVGTTCIWGGIFKNKIPHKKNVSLAKLETRKLNESSRLLCSITKWTVCLI